MNSKFVVLSSIMAIAILSLVMSSCSNKKTYSFNDPNEALRVCREKLGELKSMQKCDIDDLSDIIKDWVYLRDSSYVCMTKYTSKEEYSILLNYFKLSDSIKTEIIRIASSEKRSIKDVTELKIMSNVARDTIVDKKTYKDALSLFKDFDKGNILNNKNELLTKYHHLLTSDNNVLSNTKKIADFLRDEDLYFRSFLAMMSNLTREEMQQITDETAALFQNLHNRVQNTQGELNEYLSILLNARFNRRIIQNAVVCVDNVQEGLVIPEEQKPNYRWMLIEPFIVLDDTMISVLTEKQQKDLLRIANDLPVILSKIDNKDPESNNIDKLSDIMSSYLLKLYLNSVL